MSNISTANRSGSATQRTRPSIQTEEQARKYGRLFAKQIFHMTEWKVCGRHASEGVEVSESVNQGWEAGRSPGLRNQSRCVRATREIRGSIRDAEQVFSATYQSQLYANVVPNVFSSGGCLKDYGLAQHSTNEREYVNIQFALHHPHFRIQCSGSHPENIKSHDADRHLLLEYTLVTQLQRTNVIQTEAGEVSKVTNVPSIISVLRPVAVPSFSERHAEFEPHRLSQNEFGVTYILQETTRPGVLSVEVVLTCTVEQTQVGGTVPSLFDEVASLSQIQELIDQVRRDRLDHEPTPTTSHRQTVGRQTETTRRQQPRASDRQSTRASKSKGKDTKQQDGGCAVCHKRFHAFRWKKRCEVCSQGVCDNCLSSIANPAAMRKKKRVCNGCLYGTKDEQSVPHGARESTRTRAATTATTTAHVDFTVPERSSRRYTAPSMGSTSQPPQPEVSRPRAPPPPPPSSPPAPSTVSLYEDCEYSVADSEKSRSSETSFTFFDATDPSGVASDDEFVVSNRARRAQTIEIGDVSFKRVIKKKTTPTTNTADPKLDRRLRRRSFSNDRSDEKKFNLADYNLRLSKNEASMDCDSPRMSLARASTLQFRQLKTPPVTYELDFDWFNPFPKAPIPKSAKERERVEFMTTQLKLDAHMAMVYLRRDSVLEELTQSVVGTIATQWDGCSIHIVGEQQVFCLAYSYDESIEVDDEGLAAVTEDVVAREESASAYAVFHQAPFFMADLSLDDRFRAHPFVTDARIASYLSLPIYSRQGSWCIGTLDLWKVGPNGASSHVSQEWWRNMRDMTSRMGARIEELIAAQAGHQGFTKTRTQKAQSVGSSCDSRGSTRKADSFELDLLDLMEEEVIHVDEDDEEYSVEDWTSSPVAPEPAVTRPRRHTVADSEDPRFDTSNREKAYAEFESTIESLLHRATRTSKFVREQSQACAF